MIKYTFKDGPLIIKNATKADAQQIGEALDAIRVNAGGRLEPTRVWQTAKEPSHPLHPYFEWDQRRAAEAHWRDQARELIGSIHVMTDDSKPEIAFYSVSDKTGVSYRSNADVMSSRDLQLRVYAQAVRDLEAWERRYKAIADACTLVRSARAKVKRKIAVLETRA